MQVLYMRKRPEDGKQIHVISSGLKAGATWHRVEILQACRECCGGQGFLAANKIGPMKNDMDVDVTFEGDNTVMMQQVRRMLTSAACMGVSVISDAFQNASSLHPVIRIRQETFYTTPE